jgi:hypothetical protein
MSIRYVLPSAFALAIALGLSFGPVQAAEGDMGPGAATPKTDTPSAKPEMGTPGTTPNAMEERPGQSSAQPQGAAGKSAEGSESNESNPPGEGKSAQEAKPTEGKMTEQQKTNEGASTSESKSGKMTEGKPGAATEGKTGATTEGKTGTTAEGKAGTEGKSVKLQSQDVSKVKSYFSEHKPSVQRIEKSRVSVSIGVALPATVVLYDLPPDVIVVHGACPIKYFLWGDDVVLVDSCTRHVVEIIPGVA